MYRIQYGLLHRKATLLSVSEQHIEYIKKLGFPIKRVRFFPNALALDRIECVSKKYDEREYDFLLFGWEYERKGVDLCIEAYQHLQKKLKIAIVGNENTLEKIQQQYGEVEGVEVIQATENVNELYAKSKSFLQISRNETFSYALLEAIYAGLTAVCTDTVASLWAKEFDCVTMVESGNALDIASGMKNVLIRGKLSAEEILRQRDLVEEKYSIDGWVTQLFRYYGIE
jgi:glycosyltransferase involved in cell wall biosynthesis